MPGDDERIAVVIPALDAAAHLGEVIERVRRHVPREAIIVVDDGSTDAPATVARDCGVRVVEHGENRGKGAALDTGIREAARAGFAWVVTVDADGQHAADDIPVLVEAARRERADIVVGNRLAAPEGMPTLRLWVNRVTSGIVSGLAGTRIADSQNGFRLIRTDVYLDLGVRSRRYEAESELLIRAGRAGARIASAPVRTIYGDERSAIHPVIDTLRFVRLVIRALFW